MTPLEIVIYVFTGYFVGVAICVILDKFNLW